MAKIDMPGAAIALALVIMALFFAYRERHSRWFVSAFVCLGLAGALRLIRSLSAEVGASPAEIMLGRWCFVAFVVLGVVGGVIEQRRRVKTQRSRRTSAVCSPAVMRASRVATLTPRDASTTSHVNRATQCCQRRFLHGFAQRGM